VVIKVVLSIEVVGMVERCKMLPTWVVVVAGIFEWCASSFPNRSLLAKWWGRSFMKA
jgi:hypothetical protein